jgi:hypothetical protein
MSDIAIASRVEGIIDDLRAALGTELVGEQAERTVERLADIVQGIEDDLPTQEIVCQACGDPTCQGCFQERMNDDRR